MYSKITGTPNKIRFLFLKDKIFSHVSLRTQYRARSMKDEKGQSLIDDYAVSEDERDAFNIHLDTASYDVFNSVLKMTKGIDVDDAISVDHFTALTGTDWTCAAGSNAMVSAANGDVVTDGLNVGDKVKIQDEVHIVESITDLKNFTLESNLITALLTGTTIYFNDGSISKDDYVEISIVDNAGYKDSTVKYVDNLMEQCLILYVMKEWYMLTGLDQEMAKFDAMYNLKKAELVNKGLFDLRKPLIT